MLRLLSKVAGFYESSLNLNLELRRFKVDNILFCGMGVSGVVGDIVKEYLYKELKIPVIVNKNDDIPEFVNNKTLAFVITYSGKTKETLKCFRKLKNKRAKIILITSNKNLKWKNRIWVPSKMPSRVMLYFGLFPVLNVLAKLKLIKDKRNEMKKAVKALRLFKDEKKAERVAKGLFKRVPVIYSDFGYRSVGYYWKTQLNELSKVYALQNFFPEVEHNEIEVTDVEDFEVINIKESKVDLGVMLYHMLVADYTAYYLALLNNVDPLKTPVIDRIKKR
ncbi:MAG: SIS domain-containing protein [Nanoarchaeota archaeon]|nr:SIS domain-containing protein [Nanoarchaeota archaeon]